jgi:hypothetical protein
MGFESILFALALYKGYIHYRESPNKAWFGSRLVGIIFRDSILFFAWCVLIYFYTPTLTP